MDGAVRRPAVRHPARSPRPTSATGWRGAPEQPRMLAGRCIATTLVSVVIWLGCYAADPSDWLSFRTAGWRCREVAIADLPMSAIAVRKRHFRAAGRKPLDALPRSAAYTAERVFLILPCDWRFLPKLGPLRRQRAGLLFCYSADSRAAMSRTFRHFCCVRMRRYRLCTCTDYCCGAAPGPRRSSQPCACGADTAC